MCVICTMCIVKVTLTEGFGMVEETETHIVGNWRELSEVDRKRTGDINTLLKVNRWRKKEWT